MIIVDAKDLEEDEAIVTILHEAGHAYLQYGSCPNVPKALMERQEHEYWDLVRKWLSDRFGSCIDQAERQGSGSRGIAE
ncbi:hypothetical protein [Novipirellula artificiosorum]|uniref:Uncharacterized protein n=1 Tax=Novipirellula artificiosorum TaxID=2528016 RepID=A0A5C6D4P0_9BACT|nr:hypothetical protein [Novipirellula artificiosorum]TWU31738.1 hypothetical protein Poly41_59730 [Novipirellula artificiosorum]